MNTYDYLEPYLSSEALYFVFAEIAPQLRNKLNTQLTTSDNPPKHLNELFLHSDSAIAYQALTCYSHLLWQKCLALDQKPSDDVLHQLFMSFGSMEKFHAEVFRLSKLDVRYLYLIKQGNKLTLTTDKDPQVISAGIIVLVINLWEHAYYLDYRHRKDDYLKDLLNHLINWSFVQTCLSGASSPKIELNT